MTRQDEIRYMQRAIQKARRSRFEDDRVHPYVGAVVVHKGEVLDSAHRGERCPGGHAEFIVLEKKLNGNVIAGCTVYTTLEPCTTRRHPKVPCADRLIERRVGRVVIGMLDPDQSITGRGVLRLRKAGIAVDLFPPSLMSELEDMNRKFIRNRQAAAPPYELIPHSEMNWAEIIDVAKKELRAVGFGLAKVADNEAVRLLAKIKQSRFRVTLILNDPLFPTASMRMRDEGQNILAPQDIAKITLRLLKYRDDLALLRKEKRLIVKHVREYPTMAVVVVDEDLYAYFYPYGHLGTESPILRFRGYKQTALATVFSSHLELLEGSARVPDRAKLNRMVSGTRSHTR